MSIPARDLLVSAALVLAPTVMVVGQERAAATRLEGASAAASGVATASAAEEGYCTAELKQIVRRVAGACGLLENGARGCKPGDAKSVAALTGSDFNALFRPLSHRARIIQFDQDQPDLDAGAKAAVEQAWGDQKGASFFFVVARASPEGNAQHNQQLSQARAEAVLGHLQTTFNDPDLKKQVGLLWLGEDYAQLDDAFCQWSRSRDGECNAREINRSAFVAWIDCAI